MAISQSFSCSAAPIRFNVSAREAVERSPFEHAVVPKTTDFRIAAETMGEPTIQDIFAALGSTGTGRS